MLYGRLVHVGETLTDLHKNAFGGRVLLGLTGAPQTLAVIGREGAYGKEKVENSRQGRKGREGKDVKV